jgi:hypothetical protein
MTAVVAPADRQRGRWRRGRASPVDRAGDHRRQALSNVVLAGRTPDVP